MGDLDRLETAQELWPALITRAGLTGPRGKPLGPYDAGLIAALRERLFPGQTENFEDLLSRSDLSAESLLRAFFATLQPFAAMKEDILVLLTEAGARRSGDQLRIRFNVDKDGDPLDLLLENFRSQMETIAHALVPSFPSIDLHQLWELPRAGYEDTSPLVGDRAKPTRPDAVIAWIASYGDGASFAPLHGGWEMGESSLDEHLERVITLMNAFLRRFSMYGQSHEELHAAARLPGADEKDASGFSVQDLWSLENDYWPSAIAKWICQVHDASAAGDTDRIRLICERIDEILPASGDLAEAPVRALDDVLDLPVWRHRHDVYAVWLGAQIHQALKAAGWRFRFHLKDDCLEFAFRGVHLATLVRDEQEPELFWWTELRTQHPDLPNDKRKEGIQPDYRVRRSPLSDADTDVLVVEAKQHLRSATREFREAIEDYAHACPNAGVLLANHGPCSAGLMAKVADFATERSAAYGNLHPNNKEAVDSFRADVGRVADASLRGKVTGAFEQACDVVLTWDAEPPDLDLHVFRAGGGHVFYGARDDALVAFGSDVQTGFGPETASLTGQDRYVVAVHQYGESGSLDASGANVTITSGMRGLRSTQRFAVPPGAGRWWHVAEIDLHNASLIPLDKRSESPPTF